MAGRRRRRIAAASEEEKEVVECSYSYCYLRDEGDDEAEQEPRACGKGHRPSLLLATAEGGSICPVCFSNLVSDPAAPSHHVSYALSQLSRAVRGGGPFLRELRACHGHLLVLPLVQVLSSTDDEPIALQAVDLVADLCSGDTDLTDLPSACSSHSLSRDFIIRIADRLASGALAWSRRQVFMLHCFGILLNNPQAGDASAYIRDKAALVSNLVTGLQLPSEEIRGEIMFVLYKLSLLQDPPWGSDTDEENELSMGVRLLRLSLEVLLKTQSDVVRTNCIALLTELVQRGYLRDDQDANYYGETRKLPGTEAPDAPLVNLFADAIKGPLLSSDTEVQIRTLDLVFYSLSLELSGAGQIGILIEENIAEYVFEILRLSGNKDPLVIPCLRVLELLAVAEENFRQRLAVGFSTLLSVLHYVADIPLHPVQPQAMKLVWNCISSCPGAISMSQVEELAMILTGMFGRYSSGEMGMLSETFILACSTFVEVLKSPSSYQIKKLETFIKETLQHAILSSLSAHGYTHQVLLHSLYVLKEAFLYGHQERSPICCGNLEIVNCVVEICATHLLPWLSVALDEGEDEDTVLGVLETFHVIVLQESETQTGRFAEVLASSSWISWSFGFLGLYPSTKMKWRVYLMLSSVVDCIFGQDFGEPIRNAYMFLPSDPTEMMFLLGQRCSAEDNLTSSQSAILLILYVSSLFDERIADEPQVLASVEQFILVNGSNFSCGLAGPAMLTQLVHLYSFTRAVLATNGTLYSHDAEKALFCLISEHDWDLLSIGIHPTAFKWLFQQDSIRLPLTSQILNFCRSYSTNGCQLSKHRRIIQMVDIQMIADLVAAGDNYLASLLVSLLKQLQEDGQEEDAVLVMNVLLAILNIFPDASKQFCLSNISDTFRILYYSYSSLKIFTICSLLAFNILNSAHPEVLSEDGAWLPITVQLLEWLSPQLAEDTCSPELQLIVGILCLILHHSTNQTLRETSKAILLNTCLISAVDHKIQVACAKGPALVNYNEETGMGGSLLLALLLHLFSLRSLHALLQETLDWQNFTQTSAKTQNSQGIWIPCHDLCRLLHYGSHTIKMVTSHCLLELLTRISEQRNRTCEELRFSEPYLLSIMAVTDGLVFYGDSVVAMNCGLCSAMILDWRKLRSEENMARDFKWCRLIIEELTLYLAAPGLASRSFTNQHKPAARIAVALLKSDELPEWLASVFDTRCVSGIIKNLSVNNISVEMVELFQELAARGYLNKEQIAGLQKVFQARKKRVYDEDCREHCKEEESSANRVAVPDDTGKVCSLLFRLMCRGSIDIQSEAARLLKQIDLFLQEVTKGA